MSGIWYLIITLAMAGNVSTTAIEFDSRDNCTRASRQYIQSMYGGSIKPIKGLIVRLVCVKK